MGVKPDPKRPGYWKIDCRPEGYDGPRVRKTVETTHQEALRIHAGIMGEEMPFVQSSHSIESIYKQWIMWFHNNRGKRTAIEVESSFDNFLLPSFGKLSPGQLTRASIEKFKTSRLKQGVKKITVNRDLRYFTSCLNWAIDNEMCSPLPIKIKMFDRIKSPEPRPLSQEQVTAIYVHMNTEYKLVFLLMTDAGLRRNEALHLKLSDIEGDMIRVYGKGEKERFLPVLTNRLNQELKIKIGQVDLKANKEGFLTFNQLTKKPYLTIRKALLKATKRAGLGKHVYHHLLRHSFGTNATVMHPKALQLYMGHSSMETTSRYQHLAASFLRKEGAKFGQDIAENGAEKNFRSDHMDTDKDS